MTVSPLGDSAIVVTIAEAPDAQTVSTVRALATAIERRALAGVVDVVAAFGRIAVFLDAAHAAPFPELRREIETLAADVDAGAAATNERSVDIPVSYGGEFGPDLGLIAERTGKSPDEIAAVHAGAEYRVYAIGFAPGFPYLGGLPPELATPRRETPRPRVPPGSVGIGGTQTGIYPLETPGGWNLIGRTPLELFDPERAEAALLRAGDRVRFRPITADEFQASRPRRVPPNAPTAPEAAAGLDVVRAGMFTTIQDLGRKGCRAQGVPLSGAADPFALRVANLLVGNREDDAALEFTLVGPQLTFPHDTVVALTGGEFGDLPRWRPLAIRGGETVTIGPARSGCRGYLAVAGGITTRPVLGSRSTYVRAKLGGLEGRALKDGDALPLADVRRGFRNHWRIDERILPHYGRSARVRVIPGAHFDQFEPGWIGSRFDVSTQSDRMGVRLLGQSLKRRETTELISWPVAPGTVQVPPDGQPIVLMADAQTIGGYPQVAHVISVDLPVMAQLRPGDEVSFVRIELAQAHELISAQERAIGLLREGLAQKLS